MVKFCNIILTLFGWRINTAKLEGINKSILILVPHTSNWGFVIGLLSAYAHNIDIKYIIKKEWNIPIIGWILYHLGGIFIDRTQSSGLTERIATMIQGMRHGHIVFTPEGTRKAVTKWKTGFYYTALASNVPISLVHINYKTRTVSILKIVTPTGDLESDIKKIKETYKY